MMNEYQVSLSVLGVSFPSVLSTVFSITHSGQQLLCLLSHGSLLFKPSFHLHVAIVRGRELVKETRTSQKQFGGSVSGPT